MGTIIPNMGIKKLSISDVLFSKTQQQVLGLLYGRPDVDFYTNEIIRLTNVGTGAVQRELAKLAASDLITLKQVGNQKRYQANRATPFFSELRGIVIKTFGLSDIIQHALQPLAKKIHIAFIYGSIAKQEDTVKSDIDLMVITEQLTYVDLFKILEKTEIQLGRKINPTFYSISEWMRKSKEENNFIIQVQKQPKIFLLGTEDEFVKLGKSS